MKKIIAAVALMIILISGKTFAADQWIFFYPGEAGSTEEAAPLIDEFFDFLKENNPALDFSGAYFNTVEGGMNFIRSKKPKVGILSFSVWEMRKGDFAKAQVFLETLPLPKGKTTEEYTLVGTEVLSDNNLPLLISEPMTLDFISKNLFDKIGTGHKIEQTKSMLSKLKDMGNGALRAYAILTPMEAHAFNQLKSPWKEKIKVISQSKPVPSARVVLFDDTYKHKDALKEALKNMSKDADGKEILDELRLVAFQ